MSNQTSDQLDQGIREIFAQATPASPLRSRAGGGQHPSNEELAAYARGELPAAEARGLQEHLGPCRECTAAVLAFGSPRLEAAATDRLSDAEVAAGVEAIVTRARPDSARPDRARPDRARPDRARSRALLAVAAVLTIACVSLALVAVKFRRQVSDLENALARVSAAPALPVPGAMPPRTGVPIVDLYPSSFARGEAVAPRSIPLPKGAAMVALILTPPSGLSHDAYELRILGAADSELWRGSARRSAAGAFVVVLPRSFAEAGPERIVLYAVDDKGEQLLETYRLRFEL